MGEPMAAAWTWFIMLSLEEEVCVIEAELQYHVTISRIGHVGPLWEQWVLL